MGSGLLTVLIPCLHVGSRNSGSFAGEYKVSLTQEQLEAPIITAAFAAARLHGVFLSF
jgi:hypothetical protein